MKFLILLLMSFSTWGQVLMPDESVAHCKIWEAQKCNLQLNTCFQPVSKEDIEAANECMDELFDCAAMARVMCDEKFKE